MCGPMFQPRQPAPAPPPPPPPAAPKAAAEKAPRRTAEGDAELERRRRASGFAGADRTSGLTTQTGGAATTSKSLLGQ